MARITGNNTEVGIIREEDFSVIMSQAFATYGLSVVTDRACARPVFVQAVRR